MMRSKTMKGLVNLSQKILNCWASRTAKMSGLCPRQHFRRRAEDRKGKAYGDDSGHNCGWYAGGTGPVWGRALGVEVRQALRLVSLVITRSATGDLMTVEGRLC